MAILVMANEGEKPVLHDFFGSSCSESAAPPAAAKSTALREIRASEASPSVSVGASSGGRGLVSASSDLGSERQAGNSFEGVPFHGGKSDFSGPEISRVSGTKRSNSDSSFMASLRDKMYQMGTDSIESAHLMKMFQNEAGGERSRRSKDDGLCFAIQQTRPASTSPLILPSPVNSRPELAITSWDRSVPMNAGQVVHYPSRFGQFTTSVDKLASNRLRDASASTSLVSQPAADEGSRTGIKGGIANIINVSSGAAERNAAGALPCSNRPKAFSQHTDMETSNPLSRRSLTSTSRQMTIFYAGQAHVFDDVHPSKADAIMALAGSSGGSWSTTYSPKSSTRQPFVSEARAPGGENEVGMSNIALSQDIHGRLSMLGNSNQGSARGGQISAPGSGASQGGGSVRDSTAAAHTAEPHVEP